MHRRLGFVLSACGMAFVIMPMTNVLDQPEFAIFAIGSAFVLIGIFFAIESVAKNTGRK